MLSFVVFSIRSTLLASPPDPLLRAPSESLVPQLLLLYKPIPGLRHLESTLLQVFILKNLKLFGITTFEKQGRGYPVMVNQLL